jgi:hypothetical protein
MKKAEIYAVPSPTRVGYTWRWRCQADRTEGESAFMLYYECVTDARKRGYEVEFLRPPSTSGPNKHGNIGNS